MGETEDIILVVEDNPDNRILAEKILEHAGFEIAVAEDGEQALSWCETHVPKLIVMDISLPGVDGLEVTRTLRARETFPKIPIIALTAHALAGWEKRCRDAGCDGYVTKPIIPRDFVETIRQALEAAEG